MKTPQRKNFLRRWTRRTGERRRAREQSPRMPRPYRGMGERLHAIIKAKRTQPSRLDSGTGNARVCQGRQGRSASSRQRAKVQGEVHDARLQRRGEPRRKAPWWPIAFALKGIGLPPKEARIGRAREESGELRTKARRVTRVAICAY